VAAEYIYSELGLTKIATIHDGSPYGEGLVGVLTERFTELGGEVVAADAVNVGDTDFRGLLDDLAAEEPELIYFGGFVAEAARLAQQRADAGLDEVPFMGADGIWTDDFITSAGAAAEGIYASSAIPSGGNEEAVAEVLARYEEKYGFEPTGPYHTQAYDAFNMILDAVEAVGELDDAGNLVVDRAALAEYIRSIADFEGLSGTLNCDGTGECSAADIGIFQVVDGAFENIAIGKPADDGSITIEPVE
jgi:branched-chain amino acid transport system substrate-binding protein